MVRRDGVRLCWARSGVAMLGKVNKQPIRVRYGMAWFGAVMQGRVSTH